jgi:UDP-3-O-[3-hydroxymyristoyl] glucosamine N-acyltransferase
VLQATVQQLASLVQGRHHGDPQVIVHDARPLAECRPGDVTFLESERHLRALKDCKAAAVVVPSSLVARLPAYPPAEGHTFAVIEVSDPLLAFVAIVQHLRGKARPHPPGISQQASVHPSARLGADSSVLPLAVIGEGSVLGARCMVHPGVVIGRDCRIGDDVILYPNVVLYDGVVVGNRVIVHANAVLGADGFGYRLVQGRHVKVAQLGGVEIGDDVEIGAGSTVDRGTFQATRIGTGTKIDNLVMIAHNCQIGRHNLLCSQVGIAGSCTTGDYVVMAGQVGIADHAHIGDGAMIGARSGVPSDVAPGERMLGYPARPEREARRIIASMPGLPALCKDIRLIKQKLGLKEEE